MKALASVLLLVCPVAAQGYTVVPASAESAEGASMTGVAGVGFTESQQYVIDQVHLQPMVGRTITGLRIRRDASVGETLQGGSAHVTVRVGGAPRPPREAAPEFAQNIQNPVVVLSGNVTIPASAASGSPAPWDSGHCVQMTFTTPYSYQGGHLCVEFIGSVSSGAWWWPVDAVADATSGSVTAIGTACGPYALQVGRVASVGAADLVPGETALFMYRGTPGAPVFLGLGAQTFSQPLDLGLVGAPGCTWWFDPVVLVPTAVAWTLPDPTLGGFANVRVHLPSGPALLSADFAAQWLEVTSVLVASEALLCQLAPALPMLGVATVYQEPGAVPGMVHFTTAPVLRFDWL